MAKPPPKFIAPPSGRGHRGNLHTTLALTPISRGLRCLEALKSLPGGTKAHLGEMEAVDGAVEEGQEGHQKSV